MQTPTPPNSNDPGIDTDNEKTVPKDSSVITLKPYKPKNVSTTQKKVSPSLQKISFHDLYGPAKWTKYFEIVSSKENDFDLFSYLTKKIGTGVIFRHTPEGKILLEAKDSAQSKTLMDLMETNDPELIVTRNQTLNVSHGTVLIPNNMITGNKDFEDCHNDIKENIESQGIKVVKVKTFVRPPRGRRIYPLKIANVCFDSRVLPESVIIGGQKLMVKEYVPFPTQCRKCWRFGHVMKFCNKETSTCPFCGLQGHTKNTCNEVMICINCKGNHPAYARSCSRYQTEQLITKVKFKEGLSYKTAKKKLQQEGLLPAYTYSQAAQMTAIKPSLTSTPAIISKAKSMNSVPNNSHKSPIRSYETPVRISNTFQVLDDEQDVQVTQLLNENTLPNSTKTMKRLRQDNSSDDDLNITKINKKLESPARKSKDSRKDNYIEGKVSLSGVLSR